MRSPYQAFFHAQPSGSTILRRQGPEVFIVEDANLAAEKAGEWKEKTRADILGQDVTVVFPGVREHGLLDAFIATLDTQQPMDLGTMTYEDENVERNVFTIQLLPLGPDRLSVYYRNITQEQRLLRELEEQTLLLKRAEEMAQVGHWRINLETEALYWSDAVYAIHGRDPEAYKPMLAEGIQAYHPDDQERVAALVGEAISRGAPFAFEARLVQPDGTIRHVASKGECSTDKDGKVVSVFGVFMDVTERVAAQRQLERQAEALKESNAELEQFAYVASHDLKEPLRTIGGFAQLLDRRYARELDDEANEFLQFITSGVGRMQALIDALLSYSRVGRHELRKQPVALEDVVKSKINDLAQLIYDRRAQVTYGSLPTVHADPSLLPLLMQNLIGNGIKFSQEDVPTIHITARHMPGHWRIGVRDNGIGIAPEQQRRIFDMFQRLHGVGEYDGTGIGLAISRKVVERHGGKIWVESDAGRGATFYFTLPD